MEAPTTRLTFGIGRFQSETLRDEAVVIAGPSQLTGAETRACVALSAEGDAVDRAFVEAWFPRSIMVVVKRSGPAIIGVGVIKPARPRYTETVSTRSGVELEPEMHELGYIG